MSITLEIPDIDNDAFVNASIAARNAGTSLVDDIRAYINSYTQREDIIGKSTRVLPTDVVLRSKEAVNAYFDSLGE